MNLRKSRADFYAVDASSLLKLRLLVDGSHRLAGHGSLPLEDLFGTLPN